MRTLYRENLKDSAIILIKSKHAAEEMEMFGGRMMLRKRRGTGSGFPSTFMRFFSSSSRSWSHDLCALMQFWEKEKIYSNEEEIERARTDLHSANNEDHEVNLGALESRRLRTAIFSLQTNRDVMGERKATRQSDIEQ